MVNEDSILHLFEQRGLLVFSKDLSGRYTYINSTGAATIHRKASEIVGLTDEDLFERTSAELIRTRDRETLACRHPREYDLLVRGDGKWMLFHDMKVALRKGDMTYGVLGIAADISICRDQSLGELFRAVRESMTGEPLRFFRSLAPLSTG